MYRGACLEEGGGGAKCFGSAIFQFLSPQSTASQVFLNFTTQLYLCLCICHAIVLIS